MAHDTLGDLEVWLRTRPAGRDVRITVSASGGRFFVALYQHGELAADWDATTLELALDGAIRQLPEAPL